MPSSANAEFIPSLALPPAGPVGQPAPARSVEVNMGGGGSIGPKAWQEGNVNALTDFENRDPISGFPVYKALLCEVERVEPGS